MRGEHRRLRVTRPQTGYSSAMRAIFWCSKQHSLPSDGAHGNGRRTRVRPGSSAQPTDPRAHAAESGPHSTKSRIPKIENPENRESRKSRIPEIENPQNRESRKSRIPEIKHPRNRESPKSKIPKIEDPRNQASPKKFIQIKIKSVNVGATVPVNAV